MPSHDPIKTYDARWESHEFSDDEIRRLFQATFAYARLLDIDTITLARDARLAAPHIMQLGIDVALRMGFRVFACSDPVSTPQGYFLALYVSQQHSRTMGLMITASHNPAQYIGIKFNVPVVQAIGLDCGPLGGLTRVRQLYHSPDSFPDQPGGSLQLLHLQSEYIQFSFQQAGIAPGDLAGLRIVLDALNGSAGPELLHALTLAGATVESLRLEPDGHFPAGTPNPTSQGKMNSAVQLALNHHHHALIGLDGDGDRIVFGDSRGILTAGITFIPILHASNIKFSTTNPPPILYDPKVSPLALAQWSKLGTRPLLFRNGHSQIKDYMARINAPAAAEESGHYYHRLSLGSLTIYAENSLLTILLFLKSIKQNPTLMDDLWKLQNNTLTTGEFNYQFDSDASRDAAMNALIQHFISQGARATTATPDGISLEGTCLSKGVELTPPAVQLDPDWFSGYIRIATNEKNVLRSYFSAAHPPATQRLESESRYLLQQIYHGLPIE